MAFSLAAIGIERTFPMVEDNQDSTDKTMEEVHAPDNLQHFCAPVIHPTTGQIITSYKKLTKDPTLKDVWETGFGKEWAGLTQGDKRTGASGTNTLIIVSPEKIHEIPNDRVVTYANIVVHYRPQKDDPNRVRITTGGNLIVYPGELTTRTADITTSKILWNSILSTKNAKYMCLDIKKLLPVCINGEIHIHEYAYWHLHVFVPINWCTQVKILYVQAHIFRIFCAQYAVP